MALVDIRQGYKDSAWFTANPTLVLKEGQVVHLEQTGLYKIGDGSTTLASLVWQPSNIDGGSATAPGVTIKGKSDTAANWASENPILLQGEVGLETDTRRKKTGNGTQHWNDLVYDKAPRVSFVSTSGTIILFSDTTDIYSAILVGNSTLGAPVGTPYHGQMVMFEFKDNGTSYSFTLGPDYRDLTGIVPATTTISKTMRLLVYYNPFVLKWDVISFIQEP